MTTCFELVVRHGSEEYVTLQMILSGALAEAFSADATARIRLLVDVVAQLCSESSHQ